MDARYHLQDDTQATNDPQGSPCAWCILLTPLGLIPRESRFRVFPRHSPALLDWFPYLRRYLDAVRVKYRKGTYSVTIVTLVPWDIGTSTAFLAVLWAAHSVLPSMKSEISDAVDLFVSFTLNEPITCSYNCDWKGFGEEEKKVFPILTSISRRSTRSHISDNRGYNSNRERFYVFNVILIFNLISTI